MTLLRLSWSNFLITAIHLQIVAVSAAQTSTSSSTSTTSAATTSVSSTTITSSTTIATTTTSTAATIFTQSIASTVASNTTANFTTAATTTTTTTTTLPKNRYRKCTNECLFARDGFCDDRTLKMGGGLLTRNTLVAVNADGESDIMTNAGTLITGRRERSLQNVVGSQSTTDIDLLVNGTNCTNDTGSDSLLDDANCTNATNDATNIGNFLNAANVTNVTNLTSTTDVETTEDYLNRLVVPDLVCEVGTDCTDCGERILESDGQITILIQEQTDEEISANATTAERQREQALTAVPFRQPPSLSQQCVNECPEISHLMELIPGAGISSLKVQRTRIGQLEPRYYIDQLCAPILLILDCILRSTATCGQLRGLLDTLCVSVGVDCEIEGVTAMTSKVFDSCTKVGYKTGSGALPARTHGSILGVLSITFLMLFFTYEHGII